MAIQDKQGFSLNINARQFVGILVAFALCAVAIYFEALAVGYVVVTLILCVFFVAVAFDYGVNRSAGPLASESEAIEGPDQGKPTRAKTGRSARTA
jgi:hypothetical protein